MVGEPILTTAPLGGPIDQTVKDNVCASAIGCLRGYNLGGATLFAAAPEDCACCGVPGGDRVCRGVP